MADAFESDELLDPETLSSLERLARGRPAFLPRLMRTFAEQGGELVKQIGAAAEAKDTAALGQAAHKLGGSCGQIGALRLREACVGVERTAREGVLDRHAVMTLEADFAVLVEHLNLRFAASN
ncbi:MAG: Hpt domain-containing protein [Sandaracinaceae bacterium]